MFIYQTVPLDEPDIIRAFIFFSGTVWENGDFLTKMAKIESCIVQSAAIKLRVLWCNFLFFSLGWRITSKTGGHQSNQCLVGIFKGHWGHLNPARFWPDRAGLAR